MTTPNTVAFHADFDASFPDLAGLPDDADRIPGRELGEIIVDGLRSRGLAASDLEDDEPFFSTECRIADKEYSVLCYLYDPEPAQPVWVVDIQRPTGLLARLFGKSKPEDIKPIVDAIDATLSECPRVHGKLRWFSGDLPLDPMSGGYPFAATDHNGNQAVVRQKVATSRFWPSRGGVEPDVLFP